MPEGPSQLILKELILPFEGKKVTGVHGNAKVDMSRLRNKKLLQIRTWGKHLLLTFPGFTIRIHFLMFGSYSIDKQTKPDRSLRLALEFARGTIFFYTCSVRILEEDPDEIYDWSADVLSDTWSPRKARKKLLDNPDMLACDALLNQDIFAGVGNIIKNEVLFRIRLHPESIIGNTPSKKLGDLIREARNYSYDFLKWKKAFVLRMHWLAHTRKTCPRCNLPFSKKHCGLTKRRSFYCENCQLKY